MANSAQINEVIPSPPPERILRLLNETKGETLKLPAAAREALEVAEDPNCRTEELANIVSRDPMLATDILSLANTAAFAGGKTLTSLHHAVIRLGLRQCRNLIIASSTAGMMKRLPIEQIWVRDILLRHSFMTATVSHCLSQSLGLGFDGEEFTAGLIHDLGRLLMALVDPENFEKADSLEFCEEDDLIENEHAFFETDHCELGAWFASQQQLPRPLVDAIRLHHQPTRPCSHPRLVAITSAADHIANHFQRYHESVSYEPENNQSILLLEDLYQRPLMDDFASVFDQMIADTLEEIGTSCDSSTSKR